jgi:hypothetical protein
MNGDPSERRYLVHHNQALAPQVAFIRLEHWG